jgi:hypothetical protein
MVCISETNPISSNYDFLYEEEFPSRLFIQAKASEELEILANYCGLGDELRKRYKAGLEN